MHNSMVMSPGLVLRVVNVFPHEQVTLVVS